VVNQYCIFCHSQELKTAGVVLEGLDFSHIGASAPVLERVLRKVRTGEMPPPGMPRPDAALSTEFTNWLMDALDRDAAAQPNPGRTTVHRLNRAEYSNAVRDLLALDIIGFTHVAGTLSDRVTASQPPGGGRSRHQTCGGRLHSTGSPPGRWRA
jgi:hypothetical protein